MNTDALLPVLIGVTGHRDIREDAQLPVRAAVRAFFANLRQRLPHSPIVLLSPLAEGADRLVAEVFLEQYRPEGGDRLIAPLPLPLDEYRRDFAAPESNAEFDRLRGLAQVVELPLLPGTDEGEVRAYGHVRDLHYEQVGILVARNTHILLALWDGLAAAGTGGTADIVRYRLRGSPAPEWSRRLHLDPPEVGPVQQIHTPRRNGTASNVPAGRSTLLLPRYWNEDPEQAERLESLALVNSFNADARAFRARHQDDVLRCTAYLWPDEPALPPLRPAERHIRSVYAVADAMALHYQKKSRRITRQLLSVGLLVLVMGGVYSEFLPLRTSAAVYLACLVLGAVMLFIANRRGWQEKHFGYRALAEGLRVQFFWRLAGIRQSVTDSYLRVQREELHGLRQALRFADLDIGDTATSAHPWTERLRAVLLRWVTDQRSYFIGNGTGGAAARDRRTLRRVGVFQKAMLFLGIAVLVGIASLHVYRGSPLSTVWSDDNLIGRVLMIGAVLLAASAAAAAYTEILGLKEHTRAAQKMGELYSRAESRLADAVAGAESPTNPAQYHQHVGEARAIIHEIGLEALAENGDWVILHRDRPLEFTLG
ncbi:MAG TPA: hypothetical protein VMN60_14345 [Longimicrobiales bacterium]|nr:hypothetical protein [Longimicrobiales bacterium]